MKKEYEVVKKEIIELQKLKMKYKYPKTIEEFLELNFKTDKNKTIATFELIKDICKRIKTLEKKK